MFLNLSMWSLESWLQYVLCCVLFGHHHLISSSLSPNKCLCQMCTSVKVSCVHGKRPGKQDGCCSDGRGVKTAMRQKDTVSWCDVFWVCLLVPWLSQLITCPSYFFRVSVHTIWITINMEFQILVWDEELMMFLSSTHTGVEQRPLFPVPRCDKL